MSKSNNVNPNFYYEGDRNHQGEGIVHEEHKQRMGQEKARQEGEPGSPNFIPGEAPVGEKSKKPQR